MSGNLLHLIRDAEKKAEKIVDDATLEAHKIIDEARSEAKQMLDRARTTGSDIETGQLKKTREKFKSRVQELQIQVENQKRNFKEQASNNMGKAIDFVTRSILED